MSLGHGPVIVRDGLVLYLDAANPRSYPESGTTLFDVSGKGTNLTIYNGAAFNSTDKSFTFDGTDDNLGLTGVPSDLQMKNNKTISFSWKHYTTGGDNAGCLIRTGLSSDLLYCVFSNRSSRSLSFHWYNNGFKQIFSTGNVFSLDSWNIGSAVIEGTSCSFYINGEFISSGTVSIPSPASAARIGIGATRAGGYTGTTGQDLAGEIGFMQVYNRALSTQEIQQNYNATKSRYGI